MPLTIHAAWLRANSSFPDGQLFLWGESPGSEASNGPIVTPSGETDPQSDSATNGRHRVHKVPSHPTQVSASQLRLLITELTPAGAKPNAQPANATVWLPSQAGFPLARRNAFQRGVTTLERNSSHPVRLEPWQVTGLVLPALPALTFLSHLSNRLMSDGASPVSLARQARLGNDLLFWSNAAKSVFEILSGQHYVPGMVSDSHGNFLAVWRPFLREAGTRRQLSDLVAAMPPLCRAYNLSHPAEAPNAADLVEHFIATLVDAAIRQWNDGHSEAAGSVPADAEIPALHWLDRLLGPQRRLDLPPQPAHRFYQEWYAWIEPLYVQGDANFQIGFRLESPDNVDDLRDGQTAQLAWPLHFFLQARDDPRLRVPAREVWQGHSSTLRVHHRRFEQPQERLLAGLGLASRIFPPIRESLHSPRPEMALLSTDQAYQFLREIGPLLESSGFAVVTPDWWHEQHRSRLGLKLRLFSDDWDAPGVLEETETQFNRSIRFRWELTLGDQTLNRAEFEQLAALQTPLIYMRQRWIDLDPAQVAAARAFLEGNRPEGRMGLLQAVRMVQSHGDDELSHPDTVTGAWSDLGQVLHLEPEHAEALPLDTVEVEGWLENALARIQGQQPIAEIPEPEGFQGTLRPYQRRGIGWLWYLHELGLGACLADDMGLGKTIQTIGMLLFQRQAMAQKRNGLATRLPPSLLICPTSVVANWWHEINRFAPTLKAMVHHGSSRLAKDEFLAAVEDHDLIITSYGTARRDLELLQQTEWGNLILDEAQNIKNPNAKQSLAVRDLPANNRIALTGTPVENRLLELWSIMEFLNPGYLGSREHFRQQYVLPIERYNDDQIIAELRRLVQPFVLRRLKTDPTIISDLPEKNEMVVYCPLTPEQATLYEAAVQQTMARVEESEGIQRRGLVLSLLTKLKQICNHPAHFLKEKEPLEGRSGKLNRLAEMLEEALSVGDRALVFTQFVEMGDLLKTYLNKTLGAEVLFLHGGTPATKRNQMVQFFQQEDGGPAIFVLSLRAGGVGLNLTRANHVFHFDRWWNPAVENQATDRAFRIGQQRSVQVYKFVVAGTLEEHIHALIEGKQTLAESIVGSGENWLTELNNEQLRELLSLRRDAIGE